MKKLLVTKLLATKLYVTKLPLLVLSLATTDVFAHPGHDSGQLLHGVLHAEHVFYFLAIVTVGCVVALIRSK